MTFIKTNIMILFGISMLIGCKTTKNGYSNMPQNRYDLSDIKDRIVEKTSHSDTLIIILLNWIV